MTAETWEPGVPLYREDQQVVEIPAVGVYVRVALVEMSPWLRLEGA